MALDADAKRLLNVFLYLLTCVIGSDHYLNNIYIKTDNLSFYIYLLIRNLSCDWSAV